MGDHADDTLFHGETDAWESWSPTRTAPTCRWCGKKLRWEERAGKWLLMDGKIAHRCDEYLRRMVDVVSSERRAMRTRKTACDVLAEAKRLWTRPSSLTREELESMAESLYELIEEMHGMAESMDGRLQDYSNAVQTIRGAVEGLET